MFAPEAFSFSRTVRNMVSLQTLMHELMCSMKITNPHHPLKSLSHLVKSHHVPTFYQKEKYEPVCSLLLRQ